MSNARETVLSVPVASACCYINRNVKNNCNDRK